MKEHPSFQQIIPKFLLFLLSMGGCARKVFLGMSDLGCHDRPFLVGSKK